MPSDSRSPDLPNVYWLCPGLRAAGAVLHEGTPPAAVNATSSTSASRPEAAVGNGDKPRMALLDCLALPPAPVASANNPEQALWQLLSPGGADRSADLSVGSPEVGDRAGADQGPAFALAKLPGAQCRLLGESGRCPDAPLVCADPVNFRADRDFARVTPGEALAISEADADALIASLNALVSDDGLQFLRIGNCGWYLQGMTGEALACLPTAQVAHRNIDQYPPQLEDGAHWRRLMSEVQMLMHSHDVNTERTRRDLAPINGLWFWGGGTIIDRPPAMLGTPAHLFADDAFARGLAELTGVPCESLAGLNLSAESLPTGMAGTESARTVPPRTESLSIKTPSSETSGTRTLVYLDTGARDALLAADVDALEQALDQLAVERLQRFQRWLDEGWVGSVTIDTGDSLAVSLTVLQRSFWSRLVGKVRGR